VNAILCIDLKTKQEKTLRIFGSIITVNDSVFNNRVYSARSEKPKKASLTMEDKILKQEPLFLGHAMNWRDNVDSDERLYYNIDYSYPSEIKNSEYQIIQD